MKLGILKSYAEINPLVESYAKACEACDVEYEIIDLFADDWITRIQNAHVNGILVREKANIAEYKEMYNERLMVINDYLRIPIYPSWHELFLYENKRMYSYFFETHNIPTPKTHVFYSKKTALQYCQTAHYPIVFKTNGGAAGTGVTIVKTLNHAQRLINQIFGRFNSRLALGHCHWAKIGGIIPVPKLGMSQRHYAIIQEFVDIETEWRMIKIGDTYAGYKRPMEHGHGSCDLMEYGFPPKELLLLLKRVTEENHFDSISMDVLVGKDGKYYVTEMQSLYGSFSPHQCMVDGKAGRIVEKDGDFVFEEGEDFFLINSNVLRVKDFVKKLTTDYYKR